MAVLIEGMDMPTEDEEIIICIDSKGTVMTEYGLPISGTKAISVPEPQGRLIDTGSWTFPTLHRNPSNDYMHGWNACLKSVHQQPTIIPASEEG